MGAVPYRKSDMAKQDVKYLNFLKNIATDITGREEQLRRENKMQSYKSMLAMSNKVQSMIDQTKKFGSVRKRVRMRNLADLD